VDCIGFFAVATAWGCNPASQRAIVKPIISTPNGGEHDLMRLPPIITMTKLRLYPDEISDNPKSPTLDHLLGVEDKVIGGRPYMEVATFGCEIWDWEAL
jgi:hypothetical protein